MTMNKISQNYGLTEPSWTFALIDSEIDSSRVSKVTFFMSFIDHCVINTKYTHSEVHCNYTRALQHGDENTSYVTFP